jgi:hypothetical protein
MPFIFFYEVFYWDLDNEKKLDFIVSKRLKKRGSKLKQKKRYYSFIFSWLLFFFLLNLFFNIMLIEI